MKYTLLKEEYTFLRILKILPNVYSHPKGFSKGLLIATREKLRLN